MFDSLSQMLEEIFLVAIWSIWENIKRPFIYFFHRAHRFNLGDVTSEHGEEATCLICDKPLKDTQKHPRPRKPLIKYALAFLLLSHTAKADQFLRTPSDSLFYIDSTYTLKVRLTLSTCQTDAPCAIQISDATGPGARFGSLFGKPGDTLKVPYNFPPSHFAPNATHANLYFIGSDSKIKDIWMIRLARKVSSLKTKPKNKITVHHKKWFGLLNGRFLK